jgi:hypothetical protein
MRDKKNIPQALLCLKKTVSAQRIASVCEHFCLNIHEVILLFRKGTKII